MVNKKNITTASVYILSSICYQVTKHVKLTLCVYYEKVDMFNNLPKIAYP